LKNVETQKEIPEFSESIKKGEKREKSDKSDTIKKRERIVSFVMP